MIFYKLLKNFLQFVLNLLFVVQIALLILIFLTSAYWFFDLIGSTAFEFASPIANSISDLVRIFYHEDIEVGGVFVDGSLLLFAVIAGGLVFAATKAKYYIYRAIDFAEIGIKTCHARIEEEFNRQLQSEVEHNLKKYNNVAILVQFKAQNKYVDSMWGGGVEEDVKEKEDEAFKVFYSVVKNINGCKLAKTDDKMLILLEDFSKVDNLINFIYSSVERIRLNMKNKNWKLECYIAVDVYGNKADFKQEIYPVMERMVALKHPNEALCLGNFNLRYNLNRNKTFDFVSKGPYDGFENCSVYALVKKN